MGIKKSIAILVSGSMIAQALTLIASPFLTRLYTPSEIGLYTLILNAETIFGAIVCARYEVAIVTEKKNERVYGLIKLSIISNLILSTLFGLVYGLYYFIIRDDYTQYYYLTIFLVVFLMFNGLHRLLEAYNNRNQEYTLISQVYVTRNLFQNSLSVIFGLLSFGSLGLFVSHFSGLVAGVKKQSESVWKKKEEIVNYPLADTLSLARQYIKLPFFSAPAIFANRFSYASLLIFIEILYGLKTLGFYSIANKVLGLPLSVLSNNISKVFFKEASKEFAAHGHFKKTLAKITLLVVVLAIPMVALLMVVAPKLFAFIFGSEWGVAGEYVMVLAPMFGIRLVVNSIAYGLQVVNKQQWELILQGLFIIASIVCFSFSYILNLDVLVFLSMISISFSVLYIFYYLTVFKSALGKER